MTQPITPPVDPTPVTPPPVPPVTPPPAPNGGNGQGEDPAWLPGRLARAEEATRKKVLAELGIEDPAADAELLKAAKKRKADELSEAEKATAELTKEKAKREAAETELKSFQEKVEAEKRTEKRNGAVTKALTDPKTHSLMAIPEDVVLWAETNAADLLAKVLKEDGSVDDTSVAALVKKCREARPKWFPAPPPGSPPLGGGRVPQRERPQIKTSGHL